MKYLVTTALLLLPMEVNAYTVRGAGYTGCTDYRSSVRGTPNRILMNSWILGYVTGAEGVLHPDLNDGTMSQYDNNQVLRAVWDVCGKYPNKKLVQAVEDISHWMNTHTKPTPSSKGEDEEDF